MEDSSNKTKVSLADQFKVLNSAKRYADSLYRKLRKEIEQMEIGASLEIGETSGTAYDGAKGKALSDKVSEIETNGLPANGGNADTVDGYHFVVGSSAGTDAKTIYFVI